MIKFGVVGAVAFVVDIGLFNLLRFGVAEGTLGRPAADGQDHLGDPSATLVAWLGNRYWTFRHRRQRPAHHELLLFFGVQRGRHGRSPLACLAVSHYVLDLRSPLADNISANGVGLVLGTLFRFWAYRRFVFARSRGRLAPHGDPGHPHLTSRGQVSRVRLGQEQREDHRLGLDQLEPAAVGLGEVAGEGEAQPGTAAGDRALEDVRGDRRRRRRRPGR